MKNGGEGVHASLGKFRRCTRSAGPAFFRKRCSSKKLPAFLSTPVSTVKSRLYRGLEALRGAMAGGAAERNLHSGPQQLIAQQRVERISTQEETWLGRALVGM